MVKQLESKVPLTSKGIMRIIGKEMRKLQGGLDEALKEEARLNYLKSKRNG